jgi:predicted negative regulator of RcsB-dependent stress response
VKQFFVAVFVIALIALAGWGAYEWYDVASGQRATREATAAMMETAKKWKETQAKTIFD